MKFYVIEYENGEVRYGDFVSAEAAMNYAESRSGGYNYTISDYASFEEYDESL